MPAQDLKEFFRLQISLRTILLLTFAIAIFSMKPYYDIPTYTSPQMRAMYPLRPLIVRYEMVKVINSDTHEVIASIPFKADVLSAVISEDSKKLLIVSVTSCSIEVWDIAEQRRLFTKSVAPVVHQVGFVRGGKYITYWECNTPHCINIESDLAQSSAEDTEIWKSPEQNAEIWYGAPPLYADKLSHAGNVRAEIYLSLLILLLIACMLSLFFDRKKTRKLAPEPPQVEIAPARPPIAEP
jgi:hypothetical protein